MNFFLYVVKSSRKECPFPSVLFPSEKKLLFPRDRKIAFSYTQTKQPAQRIFFNHCRTNFATLYNAYMCHYPSCLSTIDNIKVKQNECMK